MNAPCKAREKFRKAIERNWSTYLIQSLEPEGFTGVLFSLATDKKEAVADIRAFEKNENAWEDLAKEFGPEKIRLEYKQVRWREAGGSRTIIDKAVFLDLRTVFLFCGGESFWDSFDRARSKLSGLYAKRSLEFITKLSKEKGLLEDPASPEFDQLIALVDYLKEKKTVDCYIREIPVLGISTKFFERHLSLICELLSIELGRTIKKESLYAEWNILTPQFLVRTKHAQNFLPGLPSDLALGMPLESLKEKPRALIVIENLQSGLALKSVPENVPIFMGLGLAVKRLAELSWIKEVPITYFGDLDAHGLYILALFRQIAPQTKSVLMNMSAFQAYKVFAVEDPTNPPVSNAPIGLTAEEAELYEFLIKNKLRLEQERIPLAVVEEALGRKRDNNTESE